MKTQEQLCVGARSKWIGHTLIKRNARGASHITVTNKGFGALPAKVLRLFLCGLVETWSASYRGVWGRGTEQQPLMSPLSARKRREVAVMNSSRQRPSSFGSAPARMHSGTLSVFLGNCHVAEHDHNSNNVNTKCVYSRQVWQIWIWKYLHVQKERGKHHKMLR